MVDHIHKGLWNNSEKQEGKNRMESSGLMEKYYPEAKKRLLPMLPRLGKSSADPTYKPDSSKNSHSYLENETNQNKNYGRENANVSAELQSQARILEWYVQSHPEIKKLALEQLRDENENISAINFKGLPQSDPELMEQMSPTIVCDQDAGQSLSADSPIDLHSMVKRALKNDLIGEKEAIRQRKQQTTDFQFAGGKKELSSNIVDELFHCDTLPNDANTDGLPYLPGLAQFIMSVMHRTRSSLSSLALALFYLTRLKQIHPFCRGSHGSGHRLVLAALIVASKYLYDDTFNNKAWSSVSSGLYSLEEVNQMEIELLFFLKYQLWVTESSWVAFLETLGKKLASKREMFAQENFWNSNLSGEEVSPELFSVELAFSTPKEEWGAKSEEKTIVALAKMPTDVLSGLNISTNRMCAEEIGETRHDGITVQVGTESMFSSKFSSQDYASDEHGIMNVHRSIVPDNIEHQGQKPRETNNGLDTINTNDLHKLAYVNIPPNSSDCPANSATARVDGRGKGTLAQNDSEVTLKGLSDSRNSLVECTMRTAECTPRTSAKQCQTARGVNDPVVCSVGAHAVHHNGMNLTHGQRDIDISITVVSSPAGSTKLCLSSAPSQFSTSSAFFFGSSQKLRRKREKFKQHIESNFANQAESFCASNQDSVFRWPVGEDEVDPELGSCQGFPSSITVGRSIQTINPSDDSTDNLSDDFTQLENGRTHFQYPDSDVEAKEAHQHSALQLSQAVLQNVGKLIPGFILNAIHGGRHGRF